jgi:WSC domain
MRKNIYRLLFGIVTLLGIATFFFVPRQVAAQGADLGWKVWVKTSPCSGRFDWVTVAKENPTYGGGGSYWTNADLIITGTGMFCVRNIDQTCTFAAATAEAAIVAASPRFSDYCCRNYSVWKNEQSGKMSIVIGKFSVGNPGWTQVRGDLCCPEAESISGITGGCSGSTGTANYNGCYKDTSAFDLNGFLERSNSNTPERCVATCLAKGFVFAAVQYGQSCLCGNSYGKYGVANNCDYKCTGDSSKFCGGYSANSVYSTGAARNNDPPPAGIDLSGRWQAVITESNTGNRFTYNMTLSRISAGKWKGPFSLSVPENPSLGYNTEATLEDMGGGNIRMTYFSQGRSQIGNGTFTSSTIVFGGSQNTVQFVRN